MTGIAYTQPADAEQIERIANLMIEKLKPSWWQRPLGAFLLSLASGALGGLIVLGVEKWA